MSPRRKRNGPGYSLRNIFRQEPQVISSAVIALLNVLVLAGIVPLAHKMVLGIDSALSLGLGLFYVRPLTASKRALEELDPDKVEGT